MAAAIHLKINGIDGDSTAANYADWIDCTSWSWGAHQPANMHNATGGAAGVSQVQDITVSKMVDKATPNLMLALCNGTHIDEVVMSCTKNTGTGGTMEWLKITMTNVIISNLGFAGEGNQTEGGEQCSMHFEKYKMEYFLQNPDGTQGAGVEAEYNIAEQS